MPFTLATSSMVICLSRSSSLRESALSRRKRDGSSEQQLGCSGLSSLQLIYSPKLQLMLRSFVYSFR
uniref:Putative secreted protein n=1 Tax=Anopheles darlingi TaxID=43151 RepID=A0A2M4D3L2_ANODA